MYNWTSGMSVRQHTYMRRSLERTRIISSESISEEDLQQLFSQAGTVESVNVIEDRDTGCSRGFAFVEMSSTEEGNAAIQQFNGHDVGGRTLNVNEAKAREDRGGGRGGFGGSRNNGGNRGGYGGRSRY